MSLEIVAVEPRKGSIRKYVKFGIDLYKGNDCFVPPLIFEEVDTLLPSRNPAFDFCEAQSFMAIRDGKPVGRITAIINRNINERTGKREARFGWVDFIDDDEVVDALFAAAVDWARRRGMTSMIGPMGFTDMDHEGMLIDGFDRMGTMATIYNYPYYPRQMERMGWVKDADWVEFRIRVPENVPEKYQRIADIVRRKYNLRVMEFSSRKLLKERYGKALFKLINDAYDKLYGYSPLTDRQIDHYINLYLDILRLDCICVIVDEREELVGVGISIPSMSKALRASKGHLFPFGWMHMFRALYMSNDVVDLMLVAVREEYQNKGVNALLFSSLIPHYVKNGYKWAESNIELESNTNVQLQWQYFDYEQHRRRRSYRKDL